MLQDSGIYSIYFEQIDSKYYIGCSTRLQLREKEHRSLLKANRHPNYKLQEAYNLYDNFVFSIIEIEYDEFKLYSKEKFWIIEFDSYLNGFNLTLGGAGVGYGEAAPAAKYNLDTYVKVLFELAYNDLSSQEISTKLGVTKGTIKAIRSLSSHRYLKNLYPLEYSIVENKYIAYMGFRYSRQQPTIIVNDSGETESIVNRRQSALKLKLDPSRLSKLLNKQIDSYRGWTVYED